MTVSAGSGDVAFSAPDSEVAEANFNRVAQQVLELLETRNQQVAVVMQHYAATNVSDQYQQTDLDWIKQGDQLKETIHLLRQSLGGSRGFADDANKKASGFVAGMR